MAIFFHDEELVSGLKEKRAIKSWLYLVLGKETKTCGQINIVLTNDEYLVEINRKYLSRDYYTDIITFDFSEGEKISGDMFISLERVRQNAERYGETEEKELLRVMIHGLLHLMGYDDGRKEEKRKMRYRENKYLTLFHQND